MYVHMVVHQQYSDDNSHSALHKGTLDTCTRHHVPFGWTAHKYCHQDLMQCNFTFHKTMQSLCNLCSCELFMMFLKQNYTPFDNSICWDYRIFVNAIKLIYLLLKFFAWWIFSIIYATDQLSVISLEQGSADLRLHLLGLRLVLPIILCLRMTYIHENWTCTGCTVFLIHYQMANTILNTWMSFQYKNQRQSPWIFIIGVYYEWLTKCRTSTIRQENNYNWQLLHIKQARSTEYSEQSMLNGYRWPGRQKDNRWATEIFKHANVPLKTKQQTAAKVI